MHKVQLKKLSQRLQELVQLLDENIEESRFSAAYLNACQIEQDIIKLRNETYDAFMWMPREQFVRILIK